MQGFLGIKLQKKLQKRMALQECTFKRAFNALLTSISLKCVSGGFLHHLLEKGKRGGGGEGEDEEEENVQEEYLVRY